MKNSIKLLTIFVLSLALIAGMTVVSFAQETSQPELYSTVAEFEEVTGNNITGYKEAPQLKSQVESGKLPAVDERLPEEPLVVVPFEQVGKYGGEIATAGPLTSMIVEGGWSLNEGLFKLDKMASAVLPNIARGYDFSEDKKTFTLYLREGLRWSDGEQATADDIMFWWENVMNNEELTPVLSNAWLSGGEPMQVTKVDQYTVQFKFNKPYLNFPYRLLGSLYLPEHYLKNFHPAFTPEEELKEKVSEAGFDEWYQLFDAKNNNLLNPDIPVLTAWKLTDISTKQGNFERNPYYWKVDVEGNQLPYIDSRVITRGADNEVINMMALQGELDHVCAAMKLEDYPLYIENRDKGGFDVKRWNLKFQSVAGLMFNLTEEDPVLRKIFRNLNFRRAMSLAINREEINEEVFFGLGVPQQSAMPPGSKFYNEEHANAYADYNPERANQLLDEMGLTERNDAGIRLRPDGEPLNIVFECTDIGAVRGLSAVWPLLKSYWEDIGVKAELKLHERSFFDTRLETNEVSATLWGITGGVEAELYTSASWLLIGPHNWYNNSWWGMEWWRWFNTDGQEGEEPPAEVKELLDKFQQSRVAESKEEQDQLVRDILDSQAENLWTIGTVTNIPQPILINKNLKNFADEAAWTVIGSGYMVATPAQWYLDE